MFSDLKPYDDTMETHVRWAPVAPSHWGCLPGAGVLREVPDRNSDLRESVVLSLSFGKVVVKPQEKMGGLVPSSFDSYQVLQLGDIVVRPTDLQNDQRSLRVGLVRDRGIITSAYLGLRARAHLTPEYTYLQLASLDAMNIFYGMGAGLRQNLEWRDFKRLPMLAPPLDEQAAIAKYLAHAHLRIDSAIAAKRKLIALLEEQKQAIITQAVTRGLDPTAPLKDTGVHWLGRVPSHWEVAALRHRYSQVLGKMLDSGRITGEHSLPYLRNVDVQWGRVNTDDLPYMDVPEGEYERYTVAPGDLLVCEGGEVGRSAIWDGSGRVAFQKALHRLRPTDEHRDVPRYLLYTMKTAVSRAAFSDGHVSTIAHLTGEKLRAHRFAWPPAEEQLAIVACIDAEVATANAAIGRARHEIELLGEFRARLTSDVVTGQVDIRHIAATLPDLEPDELSADVGDIEDDLVVEAVEFSEDVDA